MLGIQTLDYPCLKEPVQIWEEKKHHKKKEPSSRSTPRINVIYLALSVHQGIKPRSSQFLLRVRAPLTCFCMKFEKST
jgi:hypothetical protein